MASLTDLSDIVNRATGGNSGTPEAYWFFKEQRFNNGATLGSVIVGRWISMWSFHGHPVNGTVPGAMALCSRSTAGAMLQQDPGGGRQKWLLGLGVSPLLGGVVRVYDRLAHCGGLSGTSTSVQSIGAVSIGRYAGSSSVGNQIWVEINTIIGTSPVTCTVTCTNQAGTGSRSGTAIIGGTGLREVGRMIHIGLQAGDTGVRSVESVQLSGSTGTAGDFGIVIAHPIAMQPCVDAGKGGTRDLVSEVPAPQEVLADACLALVWLPAVITTVPAVEGFMQYVEK